MIKVAAFDVDCVISPRGIIEELAERAGRGKENKLREREFHDGVAAAKTDAERETAAERALRGIFDTVKGLSLDYVAKECALIKPTEGAKECLESLKSRGLQIVFITASLRPVVETFAQVHGLAFDWLISSECLIKDGSLGEPTFFLTPGKKKEKLEEYLRVHQLSPEECVVVGDSTSELPIMRLVGKERSIGFNCRDSLKQHVGHIVYEYGDPARDLRKVADIIFKL